MTRIYHIADQVLAQRVDDQSLVLVHLTTEKIYSLNATAAFLWESIAAGHTLEQICADFLSGYEVSEEDLRKNIEQTLDLLLKEGFLYADDVHV